MSRLRQPSTTPDPYRVLGVGYTAHRRPDRRIQAHITRALTGCRTVVNVGAGTGSYEPPGTVLACDPSPTMLAQRPAGAAPAVRAAAEALPLPDRCVDAALAVLTTHHWADSAAGIAELVRVADRQVILTWDPPVFARSFWLVSEYLPEIAQYESGLCCLTTVVDHLREYLDDIGVVPVPLPADCRDGLLAASWARPAAYLDPAVRSAASGLATLPASILQPAMDALAEDLHSGRWHHRHHELLDRDVLDVGYRLVIASQPPATPRTLGG